MIGGGAVRGRNKKSNGYFSQRFFSTNCSVLYRAERWLSFQHSAFEHIASDAFVSTYHSVRTTHTCSAFSCPPFLGMDDGPYNGAWTNDLVRLEPPGRYRNDNFSTIYEQRESPAVDMYVGRIMVRPYRTTPCNVTPDTQVVCIIRRVCYV